MRLRAEAAAGDLRLAVVVMGIEGRGRGGGTLVSHSEMKSRWAAGGIDRWCIHVCPIRRVFTSHVPSSVNTFFADISRVMV
jgi:hypothetical protein